MTLGLALAQFLKSFRITVKHKAAKLHAHSPKGHSIVNKTTQQWNVAATVHPDDEAECITSQMAVVHPFVCKKQHTIESEVGQVSQQKTPFRVKKFCKGPGKS